MKTATIDLGRIKVKPDFVYKTTVKPFGNSSRINCYKRYRGREAVVIILKEEKG